MPTTVYRLYFASDPDTNIGRQQSSIGAPPVGPVAGSRRYRSIGGHLGTRPGNASAHDLDGLSAMQQDEIWFPDFAKLSKRLRVAHLRPRAGESYQRVGVRAACRLTEEVL
jgi:hypothetical protein